MRAETARTIPVCRASSPSAKGSSTRTVRASPKADEDEPRPRVKLDAAVDEGKVHLSATATVTGDGDPTVEFYVDDRNEDVLEAGGTIPVSAIDEPIRVHAVAVDVRHSVKLHPHQASAGAARAREGWVVHPSMPPKERPLST
ncbi:hypothetical protein [Natrinema gelatinilyticum]|uniref:hypothetical protein n=1 Tax=Natrinema gelatinilyticum TaxID=2961571 RepID=UPI0020C1BC73|nr:hypothetical protein [Natrinema gelatinilyticum]